MGDVTVSALAAAASRAGPEPPGAAAGGRLSEPLAAGAGAATTWAPEFAAIRTVRPPELSSSSPIPVRWTSRIRRRISDSSKPPARELSEPAGAGFTAFAAGRAAAAGAWTAAARARLRLDAMGEARGQAAQREQVAVGAEPLNHRQGRTRKARAMAEGFA